MVLQWVIGVSKNSFTHKPFHKYRYILVFKMVSVSTVLEVSYETEDAQ